MKRKIILSTLLLAISLTGFCTVWTISNTGNTFTPDTIIIDFGDTVNFVLSPSHQPREVSQASWNANGNTALAGGFETAFGGGIVLPEQLGIGTHYYVCVPHAFLGMKGIIFVNSPAAVADDQLRANSAIYPNPSNGKFQLSIDASLLTKNYKMEICNLQGESIYQSEITSAKSDIDLSNRSNGIYFVKIFNGQALLTKKIVIR